MVARRPLMAVGYDPVQRAEQWKRRVDREEISTISNLLANSSLSSTESKRFVRAQKALQNAGVLGSAPSASPSATQQHQQPVRLMSACSGQSSVARSVISQGGSSGASRSVAGSTGRAIALTPRYQASAGGTPMMLGTPRLYAGGTPQRLGSAASASAPPSEHASVFSRQSAGAASEATASVPELRAELEEANARRMAAENELRRLQSQMYGSDGAESSLPGGSEY